MSKVIVLSDALYEQMVAAQAWHYREAPDAQEEGEQ